MPWKKYEFKGQTVYVRVLATGKPIVHRGRVELRYKLGARKSYKASPEGISPIEGEDEIVADSEMSGSSGGAAATAALRETPTDVGAREHTLGRMLSSVPPRFRVLLGPAGTGRVDGHLLIGIGAPRHSAAALGIV